MRSNTGGGYRKSSKPSDDPLTSGDYTPAESSDDGVLVAIHGLGRWDWPVFIVGSALFGTLHLVVGDLPWVALLVPIFAVMAWVDLRQNVVYDGISLLAAISLGFVAYQTGGTDQLVRSAVAYVLFLVLSLLSAQRGWLSSGDPPLMGFSCGVATLMAAHPDVVAWSSTWDYPLWAAGYSCALLAFSAQCAICVAAHLFLQKHGQPVRVPVAVVIGPACLTALLLPRVSLWITPSYWFAGI